MHLPHDDPFQCKKERRFLPQVFFWSINSSQRSNYLDLDKGKDRCSFFRKWRLIIMERHVRTNIQFWEEEHLPQTFSEVLERFLKPQPKEPLLITDGSEAVTNNRSGFEILTSDTASTKYNGFECYYAILRPYLTSSLRFTFCSLTVSPSNRSFSKF